MAGTIAGGGRVRMISGINVTPLVDVVLVLLVIMMVTSTYIVAQALKVKLPQSATSDGMVDKSATVVVHRDGSLKWNGASVTETQLKVELKNAAHPDLSLVISADKDSSHGSVVHVIDLAKQAGIDSFAINVENN